MGDGASETPAPLRRERPLGPHVLVRPLAHGRRSALWLARDLAGRTLVLRLPHRIDAPGLPLPPEQDAALERRVLDAVGGRPPESARPGAAPVEILGTDRAEGRRWVAVEWVDGASLEALGPLPPALLARVGLELAAGLADAPAPYGALRPAKVLVDRGGRLRLADALLERLDPEAGWGFGAPDGSPPEGPTPSRAGDVYGIALTLDRLRAPADATSGETSGLDAVLRAALDPDPAGRPSPDALVAALERLGPDDAETTRAALARRVASASPRGAERAGPGSGRGPATAPVPRTGAVAPAVLGPAGDVAGAPIWVDTAETAAPAPPVTLPTPLAGGAASSPADASERSGPAGPPDPSAPVAPALPDGRFRILARLGEGGMGEVWKAYDGELDELVALKLVGAEAGDQAELQARLRREVRLARKIRSPRVCRVHELLELPDGRRAVSMELLAGRTLSQLAREGLPIDYRRFAGWGADVAEGLDAAHRLGIVHRDLKPDNVMIGADDRAVILDFGVALSSEAPEPGAARLTQRNVILGTVPYMAPEQLSNLELDGRTDLYALGLILGELITGETPFGASTYHEVLERRVIHARPYVLRDIDPGAPPALAEVIDALLRPNRDERPADAAAVAEHLRAVAEGRAAPTPAASAAPSREPAAGPREASPASAALDLDDPRPARPEASPALRLAAAASLIGVLAFGAGLVHLHRQDLQRAAADAGPAAEARVDGGAGAAGGPSPDAGLGPDAGASAEPADASADDEAPRPGPDARPRPRSEPLPEPIPM